MSILEKKEKIKHKIYATSCQWAKKKLFTLNSHQCQQHLYWTVLTKILECVCVCAQKNLK